MANNFLHPLEREIAEQLDNEPGTYCVAVKIPGGRQLMLNSHPLRSASIIKIFIMIDAFRQSTVGLLNLAEEQVVTDAVKVGGAGPLEHAPEGTIKTWLELIELMIVESDNTATNMLIDKLTMARINATIKAMGCFDTVLQRKMMDFASAQQGRENYTSVSDVVSVLQKLYFHSCLGAGYDNEMIAIMKGQRDKCKLPVLLPQDIVAAHKTGELDGAEHDAGIIYCPKGDYLIAIMSDNLPDATRGREVIARLSRTVYDHLHTLK